ncbi:MAG: hypothetical protein FIB08_03410 [Candidatus Methanoperedens sp.]|nr:hypothetical protein [Candidatus Methanoperedens sp.]
MATKTRTTTRAVSSWWEERHKLLASITKPGHARAKPKKARVKKATRQRKVSKKIVKKSVRKVAKKTIRKVSRAKKTVKTKKGRKR